MTYYISKNARGQVSYLCVNGDLAISFIEDPDNTDYQQYLKWLEKGNTPQEAE